MASPVWSAARAGLLGDTGAVDASAQLNQLLGTHGTTAVYQGAEVLTPNGLGGTAWTYHLDSYDLAQPFTMSGTTIGRVALPLLAIGAGADLAVSLYTNSAGVPGTLLASTRLPASWIYQLSAVAGVGAASNVDIVPQYTNNALALGQFNSFHLGPFNEIALNYPRVQGMTSCVIGDYAVWSGGTPTDGSNAVVASVFSIPIDAAGNVGPVVPQPSLPTALQGHGQTFSLESNGTCSVVVTGGATDFFGTALTANVQVAAFNTGTGVVSAWSTQHVLPAAVDNHTCASSGPYVYVVGGYNGSTQVATVYWAQVQNGQITAWNTGPPLPTPLELPYVAVSNNLLVVAGGVSGAGNSLATYYAPVNSDGSLGAWYTGPPMPTFVGNNQALALDSYGVMITGATGSATPQFLGVSANGPDVQWLQNGGVQNAEAAAIVSGGNGLWQYYGFSGTGSTQVALTPFISVPLPVTGLTNGATYHVVLSQRAGDLNDYLRLHDDANAFPGNPTVLTRAKGSSAWTAGTSGHAVPMQLWDGSATGPLWHLWEDSGARIVTVVRSRTPNQNVIGVLEATAQPGPVLNINPTFTGGTAPWVAHGSVVAQSTAFTHGNLPFSAKVTPSGVASLSYIESDQVSVAIGHSYTASVWLYSPTGYTPASLSINWYNAGVYDSTTSTGSLTLPAGVWTQMQVTGSVPATLTSATATLAPTESGTPAASAIFYVSAATIQDASGPMVSNVNQVTYSGVWPSTTAWPPTGVTQLA